jgi:hypothetical protein
MISTSPKSLTCEVGLEIRGQANAKASKPANGNNWTGISHIMRASYRSMADKLTEELIAEGMARAEKVACRPDDHRCYPLPNRLEDAQASCTPTSRCRIGWIVTDSGRESWDVWLDVHTWEGRLRRRVD